VLSVVVPVLNEAAHLRALLPHLAARCPGAEVLVVDGGSEDGSRAVVAAAPGVRGLTAGRGRARQMNAGARAATGDVLLFLHADTRLPDGAVAAVEAALADPAVVGGRFDIRIDSPRRLLAVVAAFMNARSRLTGIATGDQALFVRRAAFEALGGYPDIPLMEDVELTRRLKRRGRLAALRLRVTTSGRKWEREGVLRTIGLMWALRFLYVCGVSPRRLHTWYYRAVALVMLGAALLAAPGGAGGQSAAQAPGYAAYGQLLDDHWSLSDTARAR
jgi:rSAM/selenodomain-associated transferase 2